LALNRQFQQFFNFMVTNILYWLEEWVSDCCLRLFIICLYIFCHLRSRYQEERLGIPSSEFNPPHFCACSMPGPWFPTSLKKYALKNEGVVSIVNIMTNAKLAKIMYITRFVTRVTWRVPLVEQELLTLQKHPSSPVFLLGFVLLDM